MLIYLYDGTWDGLMTAVYDAYLQKEIPDRILTPDHLAMNWFDRYVDIQPDLTKANKVARSIPIKISHAAQIHVDHVFRTSDPDKATLIFHYLRLGFQWGKALDDHLQEEPVRQVLQLSRQVGFEVHRFHGLLRFVQTQWGAYYARYSPDHHITDLLAPHFAQRLADQRWIIHDNFRQIAALYDGHKWVMTDSLPDALTAQQDRDENYQTLWQTYFQTISIPERQNLRLQRQFMPARYWENLTEMGHSQTR